TRASSANMMTWPKASPRPSDEASQARPRPAGRPPSMAPHGFFGVAGAGAAAGAAGLAAELVAEVAPPGVASRCVTLDDCLPIDLPPPRRAASASVPGTAKVSTITAERMTDQI